ncbi:hypothetical protein BT93_L0043 [Corymbia citriodora subsp. variegata]|uniref:Transcription factor CBF/NF-Y/archaeal histone domain-containing protein n=1 Tax=Corymbia citriodora subsp. variegata TaxID=360336 RepID=A0A8T0CIY3_CORYI|nr:hypothetical protein BT93_L0043 [Corymbia citriodora subsp. variegata]
MASSQPKLTAINSGIDVKTTFPTARVKRIMQADEDIGKVAIATPTAVTMALQLFITSLVLIGAAEAHESGTNKITVDHLKQGISNTTQFDFLHDLVNNTKDD